MKKFFYIGLLGLAIFEVLNVYFIMPMPGSQRMNSIGVAYFLYSWRWIFRLLFAVMIVTGSIDVLRGKRKWIAAVAIIFAGLIVYAFNFRLKADKMFLQAQHVVLKPAGENKVPGNRLVIGVESNGEARAYPVEVLTYHHQVLDTIGGRPVIVTYCSVCRTGRVYEPKVNGYYEKFRLVGMDHFNAMFEDETTGSWWRQVNGEAIAGKLKGQVLPTVESQQMTVDKWFQLYPDGKVMQPDESFTEVYDSAARFEQGKSRGSLTYTDTLPWKEKSWVVGIEIGEDSKAYDWNELKAQRIINDRIGGKDVVLVLSADNKSFAAFERPMDKVFSITNSDQLKSDSILYDFTGRSLAMPAPRLRSIPCYQEFWHSWRTFHPTTKQYFKHEI